MQPRIDITQISQDADKAMLVLQSKVDAAGPETSLRELVHLRASQINGCALPAAFAHLRDARKADELQERLDLIGAVARSTGVHRAGARRAGIGPRW